MTELIKITETETGNQVVSARELYEVMGLDSKNYSRWIKKNIEQNQFAVESIDWEGFFIEKNGNETKDFALSIEFAKKLAMMQRSKAGEDIRQYFIECEKLAKQNAKPAILDPLEFLQMSLNQMKAQSIEIDLMKKQVAELEVRTHTRPDYYTVMAFGIINNYTIGLEEAKRLGQAASKICKENEWKVEKTKDFRFGYVGVYPQKALERAWIKINQ